MDSNNKQSKGITKDKLIPIVFTLILVGVLVFAFYLQNKPEKKYISKFDLEHINVECEKCGKVIYSWNTHKMRCSLVDIVETKYYFNSHQPKYEIEIYKCDNCGTENTITWEYVPIKD